MRLMDAMAEAFNRAKHRKQYEMAEGILAELGSLPEFRIPYELLDMRPEEIFMDNETAYERLTNSMLLTLNDHRAMQDMGAFFYDRLSLLADCVQCSIARKRIYGRQGLQEKLSASVEFLNAFHGIANGYYDGMVAQYKICENGAYGEYKVNERMKAYAEKHGGIVLENIRLEVGVEKESAETDTLYIADNAIYSIETKYFGAYQVMADSDGRWFKNKGDGWQPMEKSPSRQAAYHVRNLRNFFAEQGLPIGNLPIIPVVVMANPRTVFQNAGSVDVYSIDSMEKMLQGRPPAISKSMQHRIRDLIMGSTLKGKAYRFFDYYGYLAKANEKILEWFKYYDGIFLAVLKIFEACGYTTYIYQKPFGIARAEKQLLGGQICADWVDAYNHKLTFRKERIRYNENFGEQYYEMALQRDR